MVITLLSDVHVCMYIVATCSLYMPLVEPQLQHYTSQTSRNFDIYIVHKYTNLCDQLLNPQIKHTQSHIKLGSAIYSIH